MQRWLYQVLAIFILQKFESEANCHIQFGAGIVDTALPIWREHALPYPWCWGLSSLHAGQATKEREPHGLTGDPLLARAGETNHFRAERLAAEKEHTWIMFT